MDITRDVMRYWQEGESLVEIREKVEATYSRFGPPTDTEWPQE